MSHRSTTALAAAALAMALAAPATAAPKALTVDDDRAQCKKAEFTTIQDAIAAAAPGATIRVCPGAYAGPISVNKPVVLDGPRNGNAAGSRDDLTKEAVVANTGGGGFDVSADGVTIDGFTVQGTGVYTPAQYPAAGVYLRTGSTRTISDTVLRGNGLGVYLEGAQQSETIQRNLFEANRRTTNPFFQPSGGLFSAGGPLDDVSIDHNTFTADEQFGMNIGGGSTGGLVIEHNDAFDEPTVVVMGNSNGARIEHNKGRDLRGSGVFLFGGNDGVVVGHNEFDGTGFGNGITSGPSFGGGPDTNLTIEHNRLQEFLFDGIRLRRATSSTVAFNLIDAVGRDGLRADQEASGNTFVKNLVKETGEHDCHDDTAGPGTAGTANVWEDNKADTENRPGLCVTE